MKCLVVINSLSKKAESVAKEAALACKKYPELEVKIILTRSAGDAFRFGYEANLNGVDVILACGGDGTLNEVVNGVFNANPMNDVVFAHYPCGSANDLARTIGRKSIGEYLQKLVDKNFQAIDCAHITKEGRTRRFVNESTAGMGAMVCRDVDSMRAAFPPDFNYLWTSFLWILRFQRPIVRVTLDDQVYEGPVLLVVFGKGHFVGNGLGFTPQAELTGGRYGITIVSNAKLIQMIKYRSRLRKKLKVDESDITYYASKKATISVIKGRLPIETDGEFFDILYEGESIEYQLNNGGLNLAY